MMFLFKLHRPFLTWPSGLGCLLHFQEHLELWDECLHPVHALDTSRSRQARGLKHWPAGTVAANPRSPHST